MKTAKKKNKPNKKPNKQFIYILLLWEMFGRKFKNFCNENKEINLKKIVVLLIIAATVVRGYV